MGMPFMTSIDNPLHSPIARTMVVIVAVPAHVERNQWMEFQRALFSQMGLASRFSYGIDGSELVVWGTSDQTLKLLKCGERESIYDTTRRINGDPMSPENLACSWSHLLVYEQLIEDPTYDRYLVLENDAELISPQLLVELLEHLPENFDLAHLGTSEWYRFECVSAVNAHYWDIRKQYFNNAHAYVLSKKGARKLLAFADGTVSLPADDLLSNAFLMTSDFDVIVPLENPLQSGRLGAISTVDVQR
jgi:GR25 family glycosyltransferase involved in LPS biosynthesis